MESIKIKKVFQAFHFKVQVQPITLDLPIIFQRRYDFALLRIEGKDFLLIKEKRTGSIENFVKQAQAIKKQLDKDIILVFNQVSDSNKKKLLQIGISYIDFKDNAYIPQLGFLFSSKINLPRLDELLSPTEQRVLIALLMENADKEINMDKVSRVTGLSIPSLYRTFKVLKDHGWLTNKKQSYQFLKSKTIILNEALLLMKNPIKSVVMIKHDDLKKFNGHTSIMQAGLSALSQLGMLVDNSQYTTYAISKKAFKKMESEIEDDVLEGHRIEIWDYESVLFDYEQTEWSSRLSNKHIKMVDPISLYLTLRDSDDPRIEEETEILKQKILNQLGGSNAG